MPAPIHRQRRNAPGQRSFRNIFAPLSPFAWDIEEMRHLAGSTKEDQGGAADLAIDIGLIQRQ
ncbi:hypothetical protein, partial [Neoaquamicrobium sediminum]|uniref:hypothetical protein n=1 Tax=Neoaquamicrobium sediminum TaxID=1849104 RepID=UPI0019D563AC